MDFQDNKYSFNHIYWIGVTSHEKFCVSSKTGFLTLFKMLVVNVTKLTVFWKVMVKGKWTFFKSLTGKRVWAPFPAE